MKTHTTPTWRPPRITPGGLDVSGLAPPGHVLVGVLSGDDLRDIAETPTAAALRVSYTRAADAVLLAEVLDVGPRCPGVSVGDRVLIQRFSGAAGIDPDRLVPYVDVGEFSRFSALQVVRCGNAIRGQDPGVDDALVATSAVLKWEREFIRSDASRSESDPKMAAASRRMAQTERLLHAILARRAGKCVNGAVVAAGLQTGDDDAAFDGVIAVVEAGT